MNENAPTNNQEGEIDDSFVRLAGGSVEKTNPSVMDNLREAEKSGDQAAIKVAQAAVDEKYTVASPEATTGKTPREEVVGKLRDLRARYDAASEVYRNDPLWKIVKPDADIAALDPDMQAKVRSLNETYHATVDPINAQMRSLYEDLDKLPPEETGAKTFIIG